MQATLKGSSKQANEARRSRIPLAGSRYDSDAPRKNPAVTDGDNGAEEKENSFISGCNRTLGRRDTLAWGSVTFVPEEVDRVLSAIADDRQGDRRGLKFLSEIY
jgi:hypothetical protein